MEQWQLNMEKKISNIASDVSKLLSAVLGNDLTGEGGFNQLYHDHEKRILAVEEKQRKHEGFVRSAIVIWATVTSIGAFVFFVLDAYSKFKK